MALPGFKMTERGLLPEDREAVSLLTKVRKAIAVLLKKDKDLFDINVNERSITHKLAEYLQLEFPDYNVDCEYNRHSDMVKYLYVPNKENERDDIEAKTVFPDIVVHKRKADEYNLLVVEVKKVRNLEEIENKPRRIEFDKQKLKAFTREEYRYKLGILIVFQIENVELFKYKLFIFKSSREICSMVLDV